MSASRLLRLAAAVPLLAAGLVPTALAQEDPALDEGPVQLLELTTPQGEVTQAAQAGLDAAAQDEATDAGQGGTAGTSDGTAVVPARADLLAGLVAPAVVGGVDPEADAVLLTEPVEVDDFLVAGFTWSGSLPDTLSVYLRVREDGAWSDWYLNEPSGAGRDDATGVAGTEEFITGGADAVQASVVGEAADLPADLTVALVPGQPVGEEVLDAADLSSTEAEPTAVAQDPAAEEAGTGIGTPAQPGQGTQEQTPEEGQGGTQPAAPETASQPTVSPAGTSAGSSVNPSVPMILAATTTANGLPVPVHTRAEWGANSAYMTWTPNHVSASHVVVHHTAGTNSYSAAQAASVVNGIYYYHAVTLGWGDIGYNFLVDKYGQVFEGRSGTLSSAAGKMVVGGHAYGANTGTMGISMMGTYTSVSPSSAQVSAVGKISGWFLARAGVSSATGSASFTFRSTDKYAAGQSISLPRITGHRDVGRTACPGDAGYSTLGQIRSTAQTQISGGSASSTPSPTRTIYLNDSWTSQANTVFSYGSSTSLMLSGDWNGDGITTLARRDGALVGFRNSNTTGASLRTFIYGEPTDQVLVGDWDGNGTDTLAVRRGNVYHIKNSMYGGAADVAVAYGRATDEVFVGDWDGNGTDTLAVRRGNTFYIKNSLTSGAADHVVGYGRAGDIVLTGDWNGDGKDTLAVRRSSTYYVKNSLTAGAADITQTYGRPSDSVLVGDWNADRKDTLGVAR
ncbi:MAG: N-acetylmuramoyl-L-alanine amidase [Actinomyces sp.]|uniref:N-acetylmuramoyl-L-alanine amidase n=1 Tax=Actinomyces sp. TaxID=29317 RepID=UPI0026DCBE65|nr:N-acetylmuramoyl-L-alanine amidase [Actinomyces sp.]MDO4242232.1 N-acetylmuramoyl-L-alanine amidase [Actinomyces sp.]